MFIITSIKGTKIKVKNLFYNTPVRLKYLKNLYLELANVVEYVDKMALSYPGIRFNLINNGKSILFTDGKYYSVTEEKQSLLNNNLASYERAKSAGVEYPLKWNSTGEECVEWEYPELLTLSLNIAGYVAPKVAIQQTIELNIKACKSIKDLEAIVINYD